MCRIFIGQRDAIERKPFKYLLLILNSQLGCENFSSAVAAVAARPHLCGNFSNIVVKITSQIYSRVQEYILLQKAFYPIENKMNHRHLSTGQLSRHFFDK